MKKRRYSPELEMCLRDLESFRCAFLTLHATWTAARQNHDGQSSRLSKQAHVKLHKAEQVVYEENLRLIAALYHEAVRVLDLNRAAWLPPCGRRDASGEKWLRQQLKQFREE